MHSGHQFFFSPATSRQCPLSHCSSTFLLPTAQLPPHTINPPTPRCPSTPHQFSFSPLPGYPLISSTFLLPTTQLPSHIINFPSTHCPECPDTPSYHQHFYSPLPSYPLINFPSPHCPATPSYHQFSYSRSPLPSYTLTYLPTPQYPSHPNKIVLLPTAQPPLINLPTRLPYAQQP